MRVFPDVSQPDKAVFSLYLKKKPKKKPKK